ncbi:YkvA family protein [Paenibacillus sp. N1-5-1-14]|uniref:YkvA family protein n=1 Tax=Paenibacillus radicibacter TaxID=2972488 RepID=UPI0021592690|nr:YkvA family protein [Paenibacillus radicibacter]MCR8643408.1 YkvA family protein [Paenibacillus radicibacter]
MNDSSKYEKHYSEDGFWNKLKKNAIAAGQKVVYSGLILYYALDNPKISRRDKALIYGGLGYLIFPIDAIPDFVPIAGYADDLGVLLFAAARVALNIDANVRQQAKNKLVDFFGEGAISQHDIDEVNSQLDGDDDNGHTPD